MKLQSDEVKEKVRQRWNAFSETFDQSPGHSITTEREKDIWTSILVNAIGKTSSNLKILDVGTGTGFVALLLAEMGHDVTGVDIAEDMLSIAQKKSDNLQLKAKFLIGDADNLPFENEMFDLVINRHVFWTMPEPEKAAAEWIRVLKPEGKLVIIDGDWEDLTYGKFLWKKVANLTIWITEGKNPLDRSNGLLDFEKDLPMRKRKRPQADIKILNSLGMDVNVKNFKDPRAYGVLNNIKHGYYKRFVLNAVKKTN